MSRRGGGAAAVSFVLSFLIATVALCPTAASAAPRDGAQTDILLIFDTSGSMEKALDTAVGKVRRIAGKLRRSVGDVNFGVAEVRDYGIPEFRGVEGDTPFRVRQPMTGKVRKLEAALRSLETRPPGGIAPEAYARALSDAADGDGIGWRRGAKRMVILVADDMPHDDDLNQGIPRKHRLKGYKYRNLPDPGKDERIGTEDDIDWQSTLKRMSNSGLPIMYLLFEGRREYLPYWRNWTRRTGGTAADATEGDLDTKVVRVAKRGAAAKLPDCPEGMSRGADRKCRPTGNGCPAVLVLGVPGRLVGAGTGLSPAVRAFGRKLRRRVAAEGGSFALEPVRGLGETEPLAGDGYRASVDAAAAKLRESIDARVSACAKSSTRIVPAGLGFGADVVGEAVGYREGLSGKASQAVSAAVMFSDPRLNGEDRDAVRGGAGSEDDPMLPARPVFDGEVRVFSLCAAGDGACGGIDDADGITPDERRYARTEAVWAANLVGNQIYGAVDSPDMGLATRRAFAVRDEDGGLIRHVTFRVSLDGPGAVKLRGRPGVNQRRYRSTARFLFFGGPGTKEIDLAFPEEATRAEEARSTLRLPSQGPGLAMALDAIASRPGKQESSEQKIETIRGAE